MLRIDYTYLRSKIDYGAIVYDSAQDSLTKILNPVQNQALRICIGAFRTSPIISIQAESNTISLKDRCIQLLLQYYSKLSTKFTHPTYYRTFHPPLLTLYSSKLLPLGPKCQQYLEELGLQLPTFMDQTANINPPWTINEQSKPLEVFSFIRKMKKKLQEKISLSWNNVSPFQNKLRIIKDNPLENWNSSYRNNHREEVVMTRLRIGHTKETHLPLILQKTPYICSTCGDIYSVAHIFIFCSKFSNYRPTQFVNQPNLKEILKNDKDAVDLVLTFLKNIGLYNNI